MEKLIFLTVVFVLYVLFGWWKSRQQQDEQPTQPWPGQQPGRPGPQPGAPPRPANAPPAASWEEELRRLLQGEAPPAPPPPRPVPPPLRPAAPALPANRPSVARASQRPAPTAQRTPRPPPPVPVAAEDPDMQKGLPVHTPTLEVSAQAYLRASQLESRVAERFQRVQERITAHHPTEVKKQAAPEIHQGLSLFRDRSSQRAAIVAAVVLGPPRSLEA